METTNLSKIRRDKMLKTLSEIKKNISEEETLNSLSLIENELTKKKYGLIWEEHEERVDKELETQIPTFEEIKDKEIVCNPEEKFNFLLEGDNLHSLYLLEKTHKEKIDVIYIDPPYNTGNDEFMYNDSYIDKEDNYRHSKWLSFMEKRLLIAKQLLKNDGLIFISIDDNELYQLKLLCDNIFDESNFIANIVIETANGVFGTRASQTRKTIVKVKDYVLVYAKNKNDISREFTPLYMPTNDLFDPHYSIMLDDNYKRMNFVDFLKKEPFSIDKFSKYNLKISVDNVSKLMKIDNDFNKYILKMSDRIYQDVSFSLKISEDIDKIISNGKVIKYKNSIIFKTKNGNGTVRQYVPFKDSLRYTDDYNSEYRKAVAIGDLWEGFDADMKNVSKEGSCEFKNGKKPLRLIKQLIKWANITNGTILDFFAGSGTTAQSVLELNKEDDGNRNFILCTNNENKICEDKTYSRIKNIISKTPFNLKYYRCTYIPRINTENENLHNNLLINIKNLIQLENGIEIDDNKIKVYLDEEELDKFSTNKEELEVCEKVYISSDILLTSEQEEIFENNNIEVYIIPEYYFEDEIKEVM